MKKLMLALLLVLLCACLAGCGNLRGSKGDKGDKGAAGATIEKVEFDEDGNLVITLTDGTVLDAVEMPKRNDHIHSYGAPQKYDETNDLYIKICCICNHVELFSANKNNHTAGAEYSFDAEYHRYVCTVCGEMQEESHTLSKDGICTICNCPQASTLYAEYGADFEQVTGYIQELENTVDLPTIHVTTKNDAEILSLEEYVDCIVELFNCDEKYVIDSAEAGIRVRGNSTAYHGDVEQIRKNQVPYRIKFDKKCNMLGLNDGAKCKNWVLLKTGYKLVADYMAFKLGQEVVGADTYCSDCTFVQVYVNQQYKGLYLLAEQSQINENRVDINEVEKDYTGTDIGYLVEIDNYATKEDWYFLTTYAGATYTDILGTERKFRPHYYSIKNDVYSQEQADFISKYINNCFEILVEATKGNYLTLDADNNLIPAPYNNAYDTINAVMDVKSIVNMYILDEIVCDRDCGEGSFYMCVDFSGESSFTRLTFTCPWDSNWAYKDSETGIFAGIFRDEEFVAENGDRSNPWYVVFASQDWFMELVEDRWNEVYTEDSLLRVLNETYALIEENEEEFKRQREDSPIGGVETLNWIKARMEWLNEEWGADMSSD